MIWYLLICSMIGGLSVSVTTGLGAAIITSIQGDNQVCTLGSYEVEYKSHVSILQFKYWFTYFLLGFIVVTLRKSFRETPSDMNRLRLPSVTEIYYLNVALALFNTGKPYAVD